MALASEAMKGLNKAEESVNKEAKTKKSPEKSTPAPEVKLSPEQQEAVKRMLSLKNFIEKNNLGIQDGKKKYVKAEVYQYIAQQQGLIPTLLTEEEYRNDVYVCKTTCILNSVKTGAEISRSSMIARSDEEWLKGMEKYATMGLSETRAIARAVKNIYGYLLTAIGYQTTPAEEIKN